MIKQEFLRYYKSKFSIVIGIVLSLIVLASYYTTYLEKKDWISVLNSGSDDVNLAKVTEITEGYNGLYYFESFLYSNDYFIIFCIVLLLGFGISIGSQVFTSIQTNYGNMIITRLTYSKYLKQVLLTQTLYMFTYIISFFLLVIICSLLFLGIDFNISSPSIFKGMGILQFILTSLGSIIQMSFYIIVTILITTVSPLFLRNKYIVQLLPFIIVMVSYLAANILGNISPILSLLTSFVVLDNIVLSIKNMYISDQSLLTSILSGFAYLVSCTAILIILIRKNINKFNKDYFL